MKYMIFAILLILLVGCVNTTVKNEQVNAPEQVQAPTTNTTQEQTQTVEPKPVQKEITLNDVEQMVCSFLKNCGFTDKLTAGKINEIPANQPLNYYEPVGGPFIIMEGSIGNFSAFVNNQIKLRFDKLKKSISPTDFQTNPSYTLEEYNGAYIYRYKIKEFKTTDTSTGTITYMTPVYGARFFISCSSKFVIEIFPDAYGGNVQDWGGLSEHDYDATIDNGIQFQVTNMKAKADSLIGRCK